ncbi:MAG: ROK family protein [Myxococcota bacterium]
MRTLCIDVGGTGLKAMVVDPRGKALSERMRVATPRPATPEVVIAALEALVAPLAPYERVSIGFPGVVRDGVTHTAPNLHPDWKGVPLAARMEKALGRPVRTANDAGVQGLGVIAGKGVEMVLTLGTGLGCGLYVDGRYVPNLELAHHPWRGKKTYEQRLGERARAKVGNPRWNERVRATIARLEPIFNYDRLYLGGGNTKHLDRDGLPENVKVVSNVAGLLGGVRLWG